jgi:hypothetical protein
LDWKLRISDARRNVGIIRSVAQEDGSLDLRGHEGEDASQSNRSQSFAAGVGRALRCAAKDARKAARMCGTPLYVWEDGEVVAKNP